MIIGEEFASRKWAGQFAVQQLRFVKCQRVPGRWSSRSLSIPQSEGESSFYDGSSQSRTTAD
jgi:hypothetical protein